MIEKYGIPHIYTNEIVSRDNIIDIYKNTKTEANDNFNQIERLTNIYIGDQLKEIPDTDRKANVKMAVNYTKIFIDTVVSITLNKAMTYVARGDNEDFKNDVDIITAYLNDEGEHSHNINTCTDMIVNGIGYQYTMEQKIGDPTLSSPFTIGRFDNRNTYVVESCNIGNKVVASFLISKIKNKDIERITAFDNKYKYIFEGKGDKYNFVKIKGLDSSGNIIEEDAITAHDLPYNPIQVFENDMYRLSTVQDLWGLQETLNLSVSNYNNDILLKINQLLTITGADVDEEIIDNLEKKNILMLKEGDAKFIASQLDSRVIDYIKDTIEMMCLISGCPSQNTGRAETGTAVETQNGHTIANFNSNRREQSFYKPKRQQLANIITILRRNGIIKSNITENDIEIKFDKNRLISITENVNNLRTLINDINIDPYKALSVCPIFEDNNEVAKGIVENKKMIFKSE